MGRRDKAERDPRLDVVFTKVDFMVGESGQRQWVRVGTHWPAADPIVRQHPDAFSPDPQYGLQSSRPPEGLAG